MLTSEAVYAVIPKTVIFVILRQYKFHLRYSEHAIAHWARVIENGLLLSKHNDANAKVIIAFGFFHDCRRLSEHDDPQHGPRGGAFMRRHASELGLAAKELEKAVIACEGHTDILFSDDIDVATCWDADRLDLMRVRVYPDPQYLNNTDIIDEDWLYARSQAALKQTLPDWAEDILTDFELAGGHLSASEA